MIEERGFQDGIDRLSLRLEEEAKEDGLLIVKFLNCSPLIEVTPKTIYTSAGLFPRYRR